MNIFKKTKLVFITTLSLLLLACGPSSDQSGNETSKNPAQKAAETAINSVSNYMTKDLNILKEAETAKQNRTNKKAKIKRSLKECIKPNDLIDEEVQMCINGDLEKYW